MRTSARAAAAAPSLRAFRLTSADQSANRSLVASWRKAQLAFSALASAAENRNRRAYKTTAVREQIKPQSAAANYNPEEIRASTAIVLPELPGDWRVTDAQIYPSEFGPSVEMTVDAGRDGHLSLFAVRPGNFAVKEVSHIKRDDVQTAYWQIGEVAYALIGDGQAAQLDGDAEKLARSLY